MRKTLVSSTILLNLRSKLPIPLNSTQLISFSCHAALTESDFIVMTMNL